MVYSRKAIDSALRGDAGRLWGFILIVQTHDTHNGETMDGVGYESDLDINEKVLMGIVRTAEFFKREHSAFFKNYGLTFGQYNVLRVLDASYNGQNTLTKVSNIMLVSGANVTGIAKRLEKKGFLIRKGDPRDERITLAQITKKGRQTLKSIEREKDKSTEKILADFSDKDKVQILKKLRQILKKSKSF